MLHLLVGPIVSAIAKDLIEQKPTTDPEHQKTLVKAAIKQNVSPFYKQKSFYGLLLVVIILVLNQLFGWEIPIESLVCTL